MMRTASGLCEPDGRTAEKSRFLSWFGMTNIGQRARPLLFGAVDYSTSVAQLSGGGRKRERHRLGGACGLVRIDRERPAVRMTCGVRRLQLWTPRLARSFQAGETLLRSLCCWRRAGPGK